MIGPELEAKVRFFCDVAKINGSLVSLSELLEVLPEHATENELERAIASSPQLSATYELKSGFVVERSAPQSAEHRERASRVRASSNVDSALALAPPFMSSAVLLMGISGSTSYKSASRSRDIDFFFVTKRGALWIFLTRALILSRVIRHLKAEAPEICLSCTMDAGHAEASFAGANDSLFARDALSMVVVAGEDFYRHLLKRGAWISDFYPKLYSSRLEEGSILDRKPSEPKVITGVLNKFLYHTVGNYIRVKTKLHNRRLSKLGRHDAGFSLLIGEDRCVYESKRYAKLRTMYGSQGAR
jgi:hypothetical protein